MVGLDPGTLLDARRDPGSLPPIEAQDLFSYLVLDTNFYTKEQLRPLKAWNRLIF